MVLVLQGHHLATLRHKTMPGWCNHSSLLTDNNAVHTGSGTAMFQNVKTTQTFALSSSIAYDEPVHMEDGPMPLLCPSSPAGTQQ